MRPYLLLFESKNGIFMYLWFDFEEDLSAFVYKNRGQIKTVTFAGEVAIKSDFTEKVTHNDLLFQHSRTRK